MKKQINEVIFWFRNDLRVDDNPGLHKAIGKGCRTCLFIRTPEQWAGHHMAPIKINFIDRHLMLLAEQLADFNIELRVITVPTYKDQVKLILNEYRHCEIYASSELELNETNRDDVLQSQNIKLTLFESDVLFPKGSILNKESQMYKVFTPFKKAWLSVFAKGQLTADDAPRTKNQTDSRVVKNTNFDSNSKILSNHSEMSEKWPLADQLINSILPNYIKHKVESYSLNRDLPWVKGTSGLSPYLAIGAISIKRVVVMLTNQYPELMSRDINTEASSGADVWLSELIWREFYRNILFQSPSLIKGHAFKASYDNINWPNHNHLFQLWSEAKTGFPIIDAAIRQLVKTGWMHNRLRMITASFLTKNCLVNWRMGERFFMQHLIDGDFAANNGGWQWSSSSGCDAQPYFRVFNPITQSKKFDAEGNFIRKWLPELAHIPTKYIHEPQSYLEQIGQHETYWPQIVNLSESRKQAITFYKSIMPQIG